MSQDLDASKRAVARELQPLVDAITDEIFMFNEANREPVMTPHWHEQNPWRDQITYVPIARLAECVAGGTILDVEGVIRPYDVAWLLAHWASCGRIKLDAYILPQPNGLHSLGVRWGAEGAEYFSPHNAHPEKTLALLAEYRK